MTGVIVEYISATWCKRCHDILPTVRSTCQIAGAQLEMLDFDELDDCDKRKEAVTALPTIRLTTDGGHTWTEFTPAGLDDWKRATLASVSIMDGPEEF